VEVVGVSARKPHEALYNLDAFGAVLVVGGAEDVDETSHVGIPGIAVQDILAAAELESLEQPRLRKPAQSIFYHPRVAADPARDALEPVHEARVLMEEERKLELNQIVDARSYKPLNLVAHFSAARFSRIHRHLRRFPAPRALLQ
jgi:hypothetical protein